MIKVINGKKCKCVPVSKWITLGKVVFRLVYVGIGIVIGLMVAWVFLSFLRDRVAVGWAFGYSVFEGWAFG